MDDLKVNKKNCQSFKRNLDRSFETVGLDSHGLGFGHFKTKTNHLEMVRFMFQYLKTACSQTKLFSNFLKKNYLFSPRYIIY